MKLGAEPRKIAILGGLLLVAAIVLYTNLSSGDSPAPAPRVAAAPAAPVVEIAPPRAASASRKAAGRTSASENTFRQGYVDPKDRPDPATIDPTLRYDLLAKVQSVEPEAAMRNLFQYGAPPAPPAVKLPPMPANPPKIPIATPPPAPPAGPPPPPPPPQAPPMTFKYYGYKVSTSSGRKEAFLLDGDDIIIAGENDPVKRGRYKIVRIGVANITIEDTQFKSTQTLQLQLENIG